MFANHDTKDLAAVIRSMNVKPMNPGRFCQPISMSANARICLSIQDRVLMESDFEPINQIFERAPGITLANILRSYRLTDKMKLSLAYIIAQSVWQYYDSDWMKTAWTSETVQFMKEYCNINDNEQGNIYIWKPYLSISIGADENKISEYSDADGEIHRYPWIKSLGIMLVEIGLGSPLAQEHQSPNLDFAINHNLLLAIQYS